MKYSIKKMAGRMMAAVMMVAMVVPMMAKPAFADAVDPEKAYLSLGADLSDDERATVLDQLGIHEENLDDYNVVYITNKEEHDYLGSYVDESKIGSRALSSVLIENAEKGSGIFVSTSDYITYCTPGMYENALATAGITDVNVYVAGPFNVSGTAALVGAIKAYSELSGEAVEEEVIDAAVDEIVTTGDLEQSIDADKEDVEGLIAYIKQQIASGNTSDIEKAVDEGAQKFQIELTDDQKRQIMELMEKLSHIDLNLSTLTGQAEAIFGKLKDLGKNIDLSGLNLDDIDTEQAKGFLQKLIDFIMSLFGK